MLFSLMFALQATLQDRADAANQRYTGCMFATARAQPLETPAAELEAVLRRSCSRERAEMREVTIAVMRQQGRSYAQAEADWHRLEEYGISSVVEARRQLQTLHRYPIQ